MGEWREQLPILGMISLEFIFAIMNMLNKKALVSGMSPRILVFYRQASATLVTIPIAYLSRKGSTNARMDFKLFLLIFVASIIGVTLFENLYIEGLNLTSSVVTSAMFNLVPVLTFLVATILRLEQMNVKRLSHIGKMVGAIMCVGGAIAMTFIRGRKLLNAQPLVVATQHWLLGCLLLMGGLFCLAFWLLIQVPITKRYPNYMSLSAWICLLSTLQTGIVALYMEPHPKTWAFTSTLQLAASLFSGIFGTGAKYVIQCWCISCRGPVFTATFNPLNTVLTTFFASIFLHEQIYAGNLLGSITVIIGVYVFLWAQAKEIKEEKEIKESLATTITHNTSCTTDREQPLLTHV